LKADSLPEQALLQAIGYPHRFTLSQEVEDEYREALLRAKFDPLRLGRAALAHP
jgi:hypothetical protein